MTPDDLTALAITGWALAAILGLWLWIALGGDESKSGEIRRLRAAVELAEDQRDEGLS